MTCPFCTRPISGAHHIAADGSAWHLICAEREIEREERETPVAEEEASESLL